MHAEQACMALRLCPDGRPPVPDLTVSGSVAIAGFTMLIVPYLESWPLTPLTANH